MPPRPDAPNGLTAWLITETVSWARDGGHTHVSLKFSSFVSLLAAEAELPRMQHLPSMRRLQRPGGLTPPTSGIIYRSCR